MVLAPEKQHFKGVRMSKKNAKIRENMVLLKQNETKNALKAQAACRENKVAVFWYDQS